MKIRAGFVSNSSSSSFVLSKHKLSPHQIEMIHNHAEAWKTLPEDVRKSIWWIEPDGSYNEVRYDAWEIKENDDTLIVGAYMDNFNMDGFLAAIGVPKDAIVTEGSWWGDYDGWGNDVG